MTETMTERLRRLAQWNVGLQFSAHDAHLAKDAADRIEALEAALKGIVADFDDYPTHDRPLLALLDAARAALAS